MKYLTDNPINKKVVKYTKLSIQGIKQPPYEVEIFHKDGSVYTLEVSEYPVFDQEDRVCFVDGIAHDITKRIQAEKEREKLILKLQEALDNIKTLKGFLPICASCKKIRDDKGYWNQIESYIRDHSEAEFSHGICPECAKKYYPDYIDDDN
jgi:PAS domain-containing protein